uniref:Uncharacterized protein n=1 Tax=Arundo donax TaxID=35708 RepID=A0A0A9BDY8_ARUDO
MSMLTGSFTTFCNKAKVRYHRCHFSEKNFLCNKSTYGS